MVVVIEGGRVKVRTRVKRNSRPELGCEQPARPNPFLSLLNLTFPASGIPFFLTAPSRFSVGDSW